MAAARLPVQPDPQAPVSTLTDCEVRSGKAVMAGPVPRLSGLSACWKQVTLSRHGRRRPELYPQAHLSTGDTGCAYHVVAGEGPPPTTSSCGTHPEPHRSAAGRGPEWCLRHDEVVGGGPAPATTLYVRPVCHLPHQRWYGWLAQRRP